MAQRVYFFKRKKDGKVLHFEGFEQAALLASRRDFRYEWEFIGWSSGLHFEKMMLDHGKLSDREAATAKRAGKYSKKHTTLIDEAIAEELKEAEANPDKRLPRSIDVRGLDGQPVNDPMLVSAARMMK